MDKYNISSRLGKLSQPISYKVFGREISVNLAEMISGIMFFGLGILMIYLAKSGKLAMESSSFQTSVNIFMSNLTASVNGIISKIPGLAWILLIAAIVFIIAIAMKKLKRKDAK